MSLKTLHTARDIIEALGWMEVILPGRLLTPHEQRIAAHEHGREIQTSYTTRAFTIPPAFLSPANPELPPQTHAQDLPEV
jgi:hypothetical protein